MRCAIAQASLYICNQQLVVCGTMYTKPVCMQSRDRKNFTFWRVKCNLSCSSNCIPVSVWHSKWLVARVHSRFSIEMHQMLSQENNRIPYNRAYSFVISGYPRQKKERELFTFFEYIKINYWLWTAKITRKIIR